MSIIIQPEQVIFSNTCLYTCTWVHAATISEEWGPSIEREQGDIFAKVWREEQKGEIVQLCYNLKKRKYC